MFPYSMSLINHNACILPGHLPIPANFTTVGKPAIYVNQYDNPIDVYSEVSHKKHRLTLQKLFKMI